MLCSYSVGDNGYKRQRQVSISNIATVKKSWPASCLTVSSSYIGVVDATNDVC